MRLEAYECDRCNKIFVGQEAVETIWHVTATRKLGGYDDQKRGHYCTTCMRARTLQIVPKETIKIEEKEDEVVEVNWNEFIPG